MRLNASYKGGWVAAIVKDRDHQTNADSIRKANWLLVHSRMIAALLIVSWCAAGIAAAAQEDRIRTGYKNPFYWQYQGELILLLGASDDDNLFQWPEEKLLPQLQRMKGAGANYVRNTMSARDEGNEQPFAKTNGKYDLEQWNEPYWDRLRTFLRLTSEHGVFVQIELWDPHDFHREQWEGNPWNPALNVTYTAEETRLKASYSNPMLGAHDFFLSVPSLNDDETLLDHQKRFIARVLSTALEYDHVLYCIDNEIHPPVPPDWGWHWAKFAREIAREAGRSMQVAEMYWQTDFEHEELRASLEHPEIYSYFEASQNSANSGQENWDSLQHIRDVLLQSQPRPINNTKTYGADTGPSWAGSDEEAQARFWRNVFGGSASSRFHRPPAGLGASEKALANVRSMRMLAGKLNVFACAPHNALLSSRENNEAYCMAAPAEAYAVYFPDGGSVTLDASALTGAATLSWLDITNSEWCVPEQASGGGSLNLTAPGPGQWAALIQPGN